MMDEELRLELLKLAVGFCASSGGCIALETAKSWYDWVGLKQDKPKHVDVKISTNGGASGSAPASWVKGWYDGYRAGARGSNIQNKRQGSDFGPC